MQYSLGNYNDWSQENLGHIYDTLAGFMAAGGDLLHLPENSVVVKQLTHNSEENNRTNCYAGALGIKVTGDRHLSPSNLHWLKSGQTVFKDKNYNPEIKVNGCPHTMAALLDQDGVLSTMPQNVQDYAPILSLLKIDGSNPVGYHFFRPAWVAHKTEITFLEMSGFGNHNKVHGQVLLKDFLNNWGAVTGAKKERYGHCQVHFAPNNYWGKKIDIEKTPYYACLMV